MRVLVTALAVSVALGGCGGGGGGTRQAAPVYPIHGINLGPYVTGQSPPDTLPPDQVRTRIRLLQPFALWIRTYTSTHGLENAGQFIHEFGLRSAVGAWLGADLAENENEIQALIAAGKAGFVDIAIVGSEVLRVGSLTEQQLIGYILRVKSQLPGIPVTTADTTSELIAHPLVVAACDVIFTNHYAYWHGVAVQSALSDLIAGHGSLTAAYPGKEVIISETGWPACGDSVGGAVPSPANQRQHFGEVTAWARANNVKLFWFEGFDEEWKAPPPQEACWGLFRIEITSWPPYNVSGSLSGVTWNSDPNRCRVAVYVYVAGGWYNKPSWSSPLTAIAADGSWKCSLPAPGDVLATRLRAYLVPEWYMPPQASGQSTIPDEYDLLVHSYDMDEVTR